MGGRFYLKIPLQNGEFEYVGPVDVERLSANILTELYETDSRHGGSRRFRPAHGVEAVVNQTFDASPVVRVALEVSETIRRELQKCGPAGERFYEAFVGKMPFERLITAVAEGRMTDAEDAARDMFYRLLSESVVTARAIADLEAEKSQAMAVFEGLSYDDLRVTLYVEWADAADKLNGVVDQLAMMEAGFEHLIIHFEAARRRWEALLGNADPLIAKALDGLEHGEGSFLNRIYLRRTLPRAEVDAEVSKARILIAGCRERELDVQKQWQMAREQIEEEMLSRQGEWQRLLASLAEASRKLAYYQSRFGNVSLPFQKAAGELISESAYRQAAARLQDMLWAPMACRSRFEIYPHAALSAVGEMPAFGLTAREVIRLAEHTIELVESEAAEEDAETASASDDEGVSPAAATPATADGVRPVSQERLEHLYELVCCVGFALTGNRLFLSISSVIAMLRVVRELGRCTAEEAERYYEPLKERSNRLGEREKVASSSDVAARLRQSKATWLMYGFKVRTVWGGMRVTDSARSKIEAFMGKHQLTADHIRDVHKKLRERLTEERAAAKAQGKFAKGSGSE